MGAPVCVCVRVCFRVFGPEEARRDTYGRVEGEGALALEYPVSRTGHPDGGHVGDQQLSEVCSHLRIPASGTTVLPSHRSKRLSVEKDAIFKALRCYIPAAGGTWRWTNTKIKRRAWGGGRASQCYTLACEANTPPCGLELFLLLFFYPCLFSRVCYPSSGRNALRPAQDFTSTVDFDDVSCTRLFYQQGPSHLWGWFIKPPIQPHHTLLSSWSLEKHRCWIDFQF